MQSDYQPAAAAIGLTATRYARCLALSDGDPISALAFAETQRHWLDQSRIVAALKSAINPTDTTTGVGLTEPVGLDLLGLVLPASVIGRLSGLRRLPMNTRVTAQTVGATGAWRGQGEPITVRAAAFASIGTLEALLVAAILVTTQELMRSSDADNVLRADLRRALSVALDAAFLDASNAGIPGVMPASVTSTASSPISSTGATDAQISADLQHALGALIAAGGDLSSSAWIMHPRSAAYLGGLHGVAGGLSFPYTTALGGTLVGLPVLTTNAMPIDDDTSAASAIALVDASGIAFASAGGEIGTSGHSSIELSDSPTTGAVETVSMWQHNLVSLRGTLYANWAVARAGSVQIITDVTY